MAKLLNLKLNYKGKNLDKVRQGKDFTKKFTIGSSKYEFWQILDDSFPTKHLLVTEKGDKLFMQIPPGAQLSCAKDGNPVDGSFLAKNNILQGGELQLLPDMTGTITINPLWNIGYEFQEPYVVTLTPEEQQIAVQYARYAEPEAMERFNRNLVLLFVFLTFVFMVIFDLFLKPSISFDTTLEQKIATLQKAELVQIEAMQKEGSSFEEQSDTGETPAPQATPGATTTNGRGTAQSAGAIFGGLGDFDANATSSAPAIRAVTVAEGFTSSRAGRGGGGGGSGPGEGGGPGSGGGYTSTFDPNATGTFSSNMGSVATNAPRVAGSSVRPDAGNIVRVAGDQSKLAPSGVVFGETGKSRSIASSFASRKVVQVKEGNLDAVPKEAKGTYENIYNTVKARQGQINGQYVKWSAISPFTGSITIRLLIGANGKVQTALVTPNGSMPEGFLQEVKDLCESWAFNVSQETDYQFSMRFRRS